MELKLFPQYKREAQADFGQAVEDPLYVLPAGNGLASMCWSIHRMCCMVHYNGPLIFFNSTMLYVSYKQAFTSL